MRVSQPTLRLLMVVALGVVAMSATGCARRVYARSSGTVYVQTAPPPPPAQVVVRPAAPYANAVWVEGHYQWDGYQYVWVPGHYVQGRAGYAFVQPRWVNQGGRYTYVSGGWGRGGRVVHAYRAPRAGVVVQGPRRTYSVGVGRRGTGVRVVGRRGGTVVVRP